MALIPGAGIYEQQKAEAEAAYQRALAQIAQQRGGILQNYGFNATFDDQGNVSDYSVDPYNEFGAYQLSRRSQAAGLNSAEEDARLRGFDSQHGFGHQGIEDQRFANAYENLGLGRSFLEGISGLAGSQADALRNKNSSILGIEQDALYNALQNRLFNPAATPGEDGSPAGDLSPEQASQMAMYGGRAYNTKKSLKKAVTGSRRGFGYWLQHHAGQAEKLGINVPKGTRFYWQKQQQAANSAKRLANAKRGTKRYRKLKKQYHNRYGRLSKKGKKNIRQYRKQLYAQGHPMATDGADSLLDDDPRHNQALPHLSGPR